METVPKENKRTLVVLLHAYRSSPAELDSVKAVLREVYPENHIHAPPLPLGTFSFADLVQVTNGLLKEIDSHWRNGKYEQVVLVGHSLGALLARKVYVAACGEDERAPLEPGLEGCKTEREWAKEVDRLVLFAAMNRGWSISHHMGLRRSISMWAGTLVDALLPRRLTIFQIRRGAPFVTQLRIQWLRMRQRAEQGAHPGSATVVQLLGTKDDLVSPHDNVDLFAGRDFVYRDMKHSGHSDVIEMSEPGHQEGEGPSNEEAKAQAKQRAERRKVFKEALMTSYESGTTSDRPWDPDLDSPVDWKVTDVVFVMHGIRDEGYWTSRIAREVLREARSLGPDHHGRARVFATETSSYGYFGMGPFLIPSRRRKRVEWFMDAYAEAIARYPSAERFFYVGHSHGTYMLAKALELYPCCRFERIVFAGSVARKSYDWQRWLGPSRGVKEVLNLVGEQDWVVAYFPGFMEQLRMQDMGGAGYEGFDQATDGGPVFQRKLQGGHGVGISEPAWPGIARFLLRDPSEPLPALPAKEKAPLLYSEQVGRQPATAWLLVFLVAGLLFFVVLFLTRSFPTAAAAVLFAVILLKILTSA